MGNLSHQLAENPVFNKIPAAELETLASHASRRRLRSQEYLCMQGDVWPFVVYVTSGRLRWIMLSAGGKEHQLFFIEPGEVFWAHSFFDDQPMPASLVASKPTTVYLWKRDTILPTLYQYPKAIFEITRKLTEIMRHAREVIYGLAFQPVAGRLASFILDNLDDTEKPTFERDMTLENIATICATSPEVVCRLLYQFQNDGVLKITRTHIVLENLETLKKLVA